MKKRGLKLWVSKRRSARGGKQEERCLIFDFLISNFDFPLRQALTASKQTTAGALR